MISSYGKSFFKKNRIRIFIPAVITVLISISLFYSFYQRSGKNEVLVQLVVQLIEDGHFNPVPIDDAFSAKAFDAYLKNLDPLKQFMTREDVAQLSKYKLQIDDQIRNHKFQLYDLAVSIMDKRMAETQAYCHEILSQPFDFTQQETFEADVDKLDWAANSAELKERWRKNLKYSALVRVSDQMKAQEKEPDQSKHTTLEAMEADARQKILKLNDGIFQNLKQQDEDKFAFFLNAIAAVFDPHTLYNTPSDKENFDIRMSGQLEGIGATLQTSDNYVKVVNIMPGSPSWLQGDLKVNDLITKVKQEKEHDAVDIFGMRIDDAVKLIRGKKGTKVTLTVRRADGSTHDITITRDVVIVEETYAKSAILTDPVTKNKVGYIYLPSFYGNVNRTLTGRLASNDIAIEIEKLKKEDVQGMILDLRSNTGGLLSEAIRTAGLFISTGPVVQVKENTGQPHIGSDSDPTVQYDGPLAVLVNTISASASEIVAAALQDYKRAVIIGSTSTFGKGTVQAITDLNNYLPVTMNQLKPLGSMFLTIQKYYRINGNATQLKGVESDIVLPDIYGEWEIGEKYEDHYLPWTTIAPAQYRIWGRPVPVAELQIKSKERTSKSENFKLSSEQINAFKKQRDETMISLNLEKFRKEEQKRNAENKRFDELNEKLTRLVITAPNVDLDAIKGDTAKIARNDKWLKAMNKDIYLEEAVQVVGDMK